MEIITRELASQLGKPYLKKNAEKDFNRLDKLDIFSYIRIQPIEGRWRSFLDADGSQKPRPH